MLFSSCFECCFEQSIAEVFSIFGETGDGVLQRVAGGELGEGDEGGEAGGEVRVVDDAGLEEEAASFFIETQGAGGVAPEDGIGGEEGGTMSVVIEMAESVEGPQGVDGSDAGLADFFLKGLERVGSGGLYFINEKALGGEAPELVVVAEGGYQFGRGGTLEGGDG